MSFSVSPPQEGVSVKLSVSAPALKMSVVPSECCDKVQAPPFPSSSSSVQVPSEALCAVLPLNGNAGGGMKSICVRIMTPKDYTAVRELVPQVSQCVMTHSREEITEILSIPTYHPFCAFDGSNPTRLIAFAELHRMPHIGRTFDGRLERVVVADSERGLGVASTLCHFIVEKAKDVLNCNRVDLTAENERAKHIYTNKLGFEPVNTNVFRLKF